MALTEGITPFFQRRQTACQNSSRDNPLPAEMLRRDRASKA
jgi:hypothetical protein